jgi:murein DD-endopeptidase MepM/ murein hydrolase activator NlpD
LLLLLLSGCVRPDPELEGVATLAPLGAPAGNIPPGATAPPGRPASPEESAAPAAATRPGAPTPVLPPYPGTPTPDPIDPGETGSDGTPYLIHSVGVGETLNYIAQRYGSTPEELVALNDLNADDFLSVGQEIRVPGGSTQASPNFKIIPDSELVYGPAARDFDVGAFVSYFDSYLSRHQEEVEGTLLDGPQIVQLVADRFSVNPRLLLAALEYRVGWVSQPQPGELDYPMGRVQAGTEGLYRQLAWAADQLNWGYYGRAEGGLTGVTIGDTTIAFSPQINDGTAGVQRWLSAHSGATSDLWLQGAGPSGFFATYSRLFGNPFAYTVDPLWPDGLAAPELALPWSAGETWYMTGGPHGGWASGSAWAALDFVPHHEQLGCYPSDAWVLAMAPGVVTRSSFGAVVVDSDGDGYAGTGWAITYQHVETRDRIALGARVATGDPLGHPSCEGGFSNGTHVHISRTYNGRWVSADGSLPFLMNGWRSLGLGREYDGQLVRGDEVKEACECRGDINAIPGGPVPTN